MNRIVGHHDLLWITLDTLRYDVAANALAAGQTPTLAEFLPGGRWQLRHAPASFTLASHQAMFAGFLPTPARPGRHQRLFALRFDGSATTGPGTLVLDAPDIISGLAGLGYHTLCIGGVGFFNKRTALGRVLPALFADSHWSPELGVTNRDSTAHQVTLAGRLLARFPADRRVLLFINISALHQPNHFYAAGAGADSAATQQAALAYVDSQLAPLFALMRERAPTFCIACSDHGTAYGEDGYTGHRIGHPVVWNVPYAEFFLRSAPDEMPDTVQDDMTDDMTDDIDKDAR
jgi:hypothetical protein